MKQNQFKLYPALLIALFMVMTGCNKDFEREIPNKTYTDSVSIAFGNPKVLLLIADGARGISVRDARTPVISSLLRNSIYSWNSLADDENPESGTNWTDLLTGVKASKHGVIGDDFSKSQFQDYPLIFSRIKAAKPNAKIVSFAATPMFSEKLNAGVDVSETPGNDEGVKAGIVNSLKTDTASFIVGQFKEIGEAGAEHGYDVSKPQYKAAIQRFDTEVGEMLEALKSRPNYANESWLVVVVSNNGGSYQIPVEQDDKTVFSNPKVNTFTIIYNPKYSVRILNKPFLGNKYNGVGVRLHGNVNEGVRATALNSELFNFGDKTPFSVELKLKKNPGPSGNYRYSWPSVIGKRPQWAGGWPTKGWVIYLENNNWHLNIRTDKVADQVLGGSISDGNWNTLAFVRSNEGGRMIITTYTDGKENNKRDVTDWGDFDSNEPLTLGVLAGDGHGIMDGTVSDVRIWKVALPASVISQFSCDTEIDENHPFFDYLLGYWPCTDGSGNVFKDKGAAGSDFKIQGNYEWAKFSDLMCAPSASDFGATVPRNMDMTTQLLSWLRIPVQESWKLDGRVWLDQ
ncbi:alkaline phosphatase family protein [Pedobacter sp. B4-66]|uniref:alkaline phosphatase family protein n=1 Tax=Pedobacter sp. B4-66 TaxID=2817280 RepID=UPI001BDACBE7|nr:alkaline phosphatase family protein [Pedobacter sp. B4-66]